MGHCAYTIQRVNQTKGKQTGILGIPVPTIPAHYMIGDLMVNFYHSLDKARKCQKVRTNPLPVNDGKSLEQISEATFIEFWQMKRKILMKTSSGITITIQKENFPLESLSS